MNSPFQGGPARAFVALGANLGDRRGHLERAVQAPRLHWDGECVQVEPGFSEEALDALRARFPTNVWPEHNVYFGGVQAVSGEGHGAGDPRRGGVCRIV